MTRRTSLELELSKTRPKNAADFGQFGNAAAMREALVSIRALIDDEPDGTPMIDAIKATIDAALTAPRRNCDVGDANDWSKRFGEECDKGHLCSDCPVRHAKTRMAIEFDKGASCEFVWAQMPYEEGGAM